MTRSLFLRATLTLLGLLALPRVADAQSPQDKTRRLIDTFKKVKTAPKADKDAAAKLSAADQAANQKTFAALDGFFDYPTFGADCLGPAAAKLSAAQQKEFKDRLIAILKSRGYPNGGTFFNEGVIKEKPGKPAEVDGRTTVPVTVTFPKDDITTELAFVWKGGKVVDLRLDGDSLAKDYRNQVGRIVAKSGPEDLLRRLAEKQKGDE